MLIKIFKIGDELIFNLDGKTVSIVLSDKEGRQVALKINAERSIGFTHVKKDSVHVTGCPV